MVAPLLNSLPFDRKNYHNHLSHFHHQHVSNSGYHVRSEDELSAVSVGSLGMGGGSSHGGGHGGGGGGHTSSPRQRRRRSSRTSVGSAAAAVQGKLLIFILHCIDYLGSLLEHFFSEFDAMLSLIDMILCLRNSMF